MEISGTETVAGDHHGSGQKTNPFVGPRPLVAGEPLWGRGREIRELDDELSSQRIVLLYSPSGAGKSSLVQAGLLPRLQQAFDIWGPVRLHFPVPPTVDPNHCNRYALSAMAGFEAQVPPHLQRSPEALAALSLYTYGTTRPRRRLASGNKLLVFDQFEEILTVDPMAREAKQHFFDQLGELLRDPSFWALFVLREDYLAGLDPFRFQVPTHLQNRYRMDLLGLEAAHDAMVQPVHASGCAFPAAGDLARDLATRRVQRGDGSFVDEVGHHVEPVQLQVVCRRLWEALPPGKASIDLEDLEQFGDVDEALAGYYADSVAALGNDVAQEREIRDWIDDHLINADGIRGQALRGIGKSEGLANTLVQGLLDTHLIRAEARAGATWYELAHDRLVEPIQANNRAWRTAHLSEVQRRARVWEQQGNPPGLVLADAALKSGERWAAEARVVLEVEKRFLEASRRAQVALDRERRQARLIRGIAIVATLLGTLALFQWRLAEERRRGAENLTRAAVAANRLAAGQSAEGGLMALEVDDPRHTTSALETLHRALAAPVEAKVLEGHTDEVKAVMWDPGGQRLLTISWDDTARIWDPTSGKTLGVLEGHGGDLTAAAWHPDSRRVATASDDGTVRLWSISEGGAVGSGETLAASSDEAASAFALSWSPDGQRLAIMDRLGDVRVWNPESEQVMLALDSPPFEVELTEEPKHFTVAWSPDGRFLAANQGSKIIVWGADDGESIASLEGTPELVLTLAWSPDGRYLASGGADATASIWDPVAGTRIALLEGHTDWIVSLGWHPDGQWLATASLDRTARLWDLDGAPTAVFEGHTAVLWSLSWSPDGHWLATASDDRTVRLWKPGVDRAVAVLSGHGGQVQTAAWDPSGQWIATSSADRTSRLWRATGSGEALTILWGHSAEVYGASWGPEGRILTASADQTARLWDPDTAREIRRFEGHGGWLQEAAWSPDGRRVATAASDSTVRVWDTSSGDQLAVLEGHTERLWDVDWSPDGQRIATAAWDSTARLWDASTGTHLATLPHGEKVIVAVWDPTGSRLLTASAGGLARVWSANLPPAHAGPSTLEPMKTLEGHGDTIYAALWSPDGERLFTVSGDGTARIWNAEDGKSVTTLRGHQAEVVVGAWDPDGTRVVTGSWDGTARLFDAQSGELLRLFDDHPDSLSAVAWSPNGRWIATATWSGSTHLWSVVDGSLLNTFGGHEAVVRTLDWSPDGQRLLTSSDDQTARVWAVSEHYVDFLRGRIRARNHRCLTPEFFTQHLGVSEAEASQRRARCEGCLPRFFGSLETADPTPPSGQPYEKAWGAYAACVAE